jgi:hypothetical protein
LISRAKTPFETAKISACAVPVVKIADLPAKGGVLLDWLDSRELSRMCLA